MLFSPNLSIIRKGLEKNIPELDFGTTKIIGDGFRSVAIEVGGKHIFLIGKHDRASVTYSREYELLPKLSRQVFVKIPNPKWFKNATAEFPHGFVGYKKIDGRPLTAGDVSKIDHINIAKELADFFQQIHSFPVEEAREIGIPDHSDFLIDDEKAFKETLPILKRELLAHELKLVNQWWRAYQNDPAMRDFRASLIHGDLWYENLILDENLRHVRGIIDFESCEINDPAKDFAPLFYLGDEFAYAAISHYLKNSEEKGAAFRQRVVRHWQRRNAELGGIQYALEHNNTEELQDSILKIRKGPILNGSFEKELAANNKNQV